MMSDNTVAGDEEVIVTLKLRFRPGTIAEALDRIVPIAAMTREEPGNIEFNVFRARDDDDQLVIFERWVNQAALERHWQEDYTKEVLAIFERDLAAPLSERDDVTYLRDMLRAAG